MPRRHAGRIDWRRLVGSWRQSVEWDLALPLPRVVVKIPVKTLKS